MNGFIGKYLGTLITSIAIMSIAGLVAWGAQQNQISNLPSPDEHGRMAEKVDRMEKEHDPEAFGDLKSSIAVLTSTLGTANSTLLKMEVQQDKMFATLIELEITVGNLKEEVKSLERKHN